MSVRQRDQVSDERSLAEIILFDVDKSTAMNIELFYLNIRGKETSSFETLVRPDVNLFHLFADYLVNEHS